MINVSAELKRLYKDLVCYAKLWVHMHVYFLLMSTSGSNLWCSFRLSLLGILIDFFPTFWERMTSKCSPWELFRFTEKCRKPFKKINWHVAQLVDKVCLSFLFWKDNNIFFICKAEVLLGQTLFRRFHSSLWLLENG